MPETSPNKVAIKVSLVPLLKSLVFPAVGFLVFLGVAGFIVNEYVVSGTKKIAPEPVKVTRGRATSTPTAIVKVEQPIENLTTQAVPQTPATPQPSQVPPEPEKRFGRKAISTTPTTNAKSVEQPTENLTTPAVTQTPVTSPPSEVPVRDDLILYVKTLNARWQEFEVEFQDYGMKAKGKMDKLSPEEKEKLYFSEGISQFETFINKGIQVANDEIKPQTKEVIEIHERFVELAKELCRISIRGMRKPTEQGALKSLFADINSRVGTMTSDQIARENERKREMEEMKELNEQFSFHVKKWLSDLRLLGLKNNYPFEPTKELIFLRGFPMGG